MGFSGHVPAASRDPIPALGTAQDFGNRVTKAAVAGPIQTGHQTVFPTIF